MHSKRRKAGVNRLHTSLTPQNGIPRLLRLLNTLRADVNVRQTRYNRVNKRPGRRFILKLTAEQETICASGAQAVRVIAYAGTGKTSTLVAWSLAHPQWRTLYIAFNKSVQTEASQRFPRHVTAKTSHSLAFAAVGHLYAHKIGSLSPYYLSRTLNGPGRLSPVQSLYYQLILDTLVSFWSSTDEELTPALIPLTGVNSALIPALDLGKVARDAQKVWERMQDPADPSVPMTHDGYLKLYGLTHPHLPFDAILFDEAQDANPVTLQIVTEQSHAQLVFVGDPWQAIYGFRGAVNAMDIAPADQTFRLTGSFRFGPEIAGVATRLLQWRTASTPALRGLGEKAPLAPGVKPKEAVICRTNAGLFAEAVRVLTENPGARLGFVGGIRGYQFDLLEQVYTLWAKRPPRDPFLSLFATFEQLQAYAQDSRDVTLRVRCRLVQEYGHAIPLWLKKITAAAGEPASADVILSTTHKSKGLEFDHIRLGDDYIDLLEERRRWLLWNNMPPGPAKDAYYQDSVLPQEEINMLYVASTRATRQLMLPPSVYTALVPSAKPRKTS